MRPYVVQVGASTVGSLNSTRLNGEPVKLKTQYKW